MSEKMREGFEAWAKNQGYELWVSCSAQIVCGLTTSVAVAPGYTSQETQKAWEAWQASRESLVIELPPIWEESPNTALGQACAQIRTADIQAIKAAGLKVANQ
ncbi:hypothetical protein BK660_21650 [Pseudomonas brassicacearum]|uniref:Uncharacterized protein n=2 Tax=Pseudomonas brassicacearum TaxID=930166 RepID=A0A423HXX5_9PSED|nr:hypothetical protein BK660_21650 [Pseudomonas brassicacearum]